MDGPFPGYDALRFSVTEAVDATVLSFLGRQLKAYNDVVSTYHRELRSAGSRPLAILAHDGEGALAGGVAGETYWGWLEVVILWLQEGWRQQGHGQRMMQMAEVEAKGRGCHRAWVRTFSFQARGFYERIGYRVVGRLDDYPPGEAFFWLRKDF